MKRMAALAGALLLVLLMVGPAAAKPLAHERYAWTDSCTWDDCGPTYATEGTWAQTVLYKEARQDGPPMITWRYDWEAVTRNPDNDKSVTEYGKGMWKDLRAWPVEGTVYHSVTQQVGATYTLETADGTKIVMDNGLARFEFYADPGPDPADPSDDFFVTHPMVVAAHGLHQSWDVDFCTLVNELLG